MPRRKRQSHRMRAMMMRHDAAMDAIRANPHMHEDDRCDLLLAVIAPSKELLRASMEAAGRKR